MTRLAGRIADDVVSSATLVTRTSGETQIIPAYRFTNPDGTVLDLTPYQAAGYTVTAETNAIDNPDFSSPTSFAGGFRSPYTSGIVETTQTSPNAVRLITPGIYQVRYRVDAGGGGPYFYSDAFFVVLNGHGPSPTANIGGINP